ncbi:unnamed protein product [Effrenium voratum]|uniref:Uncharacterized protein n=1 Tax=Effrenium voratum TaxID=2562239 RepID=A0AA36N8L6_9DINO|nr:unnamed protein product [Effrenium voratum]
MNVERGASELQSLTEGETLQRLARHCRQMWHQLPSPRQNGSMPSPRMTDAAAKTSGRSAEGDYGSRLRALREAADRIACPNGI